MQTMNQKSESDLKSASVEKLYECFRGELSAVETYELALKSIDHVGLHHTLQELLSSHARRAELVRDQISRLGLEMPKSSGAWGTFTKAVQAGADLLGDRAAIAVLEEGEDRGLARYTSDLAGCDPKTRKLIEEQLLPEQQRTHQLCKTLKSYVMAPS
jgi:hypothetical protein